MTLLNCTLWLYYCTITDNMQASFVTNALGVVLEGSFVAIFLRFSPPRRFRQLTLLLATLGPATAAFLWASRLVEGALQQARLRFRVELVPAAPPNGAETADRRRCNRWAY